LAPTRPKPGKEGGREGGREGRREGGREGWREGGGEMWLVKGVRETGKAGKYSEI